MPTAMRIAPSDDCACDQKSTFADKPCSNFVRCKSESFTTTLPAPKTGGHGCKTIVANTTSAIRRTRNSGIMCTVSVKLVEQSGHVSNSTIHRSWVESTKSVIASVFEFLGSPINMRMRIPKFLNPTPAGNPNTDSNFRKRWSRVRSKKTGAMLAFCPA